MNDDELLEERARSLAAQKHQLKTTQDKLAEAYHGLNEIFESQVENNLDDLLDAAQHLSTDEDIVLVFDEEDDELLIDTSHPEIDDSRKPIKELSLLEGITIDSSSDWKRYSEQVQKYLTKNNVELGKDPFKDLMTTSQRIELEKRIRDEFTLKKAHCDKYDYVIAATCGFIGGLVDILFVGLPGVGKLTHFTDEMTNNVIEKCALFFGWPGPNEGSDSTSSAIGFLERKFQVNYDQRYGADVAGKFKMSTKNHHIKSLAHSPDLIGLFFSILDQFTNSAHFVDRGKVIKIATETHELTGYNLIAKVFAGFVNWMGHLFSDAGGSSGSKGRGSGIPIPFYPLLQFVNVGEFGQHRQTFAQLAVQAFEQGYDFRHGLALAIPVAITELLARITWVAKRHYYDKRKWRECVPKASNPEIRRVLLVAHGTLCLMDTVDAALRSGGEVVQFMLRSNVVAWVRLGHLGLQELKACFREGSLDHESVDNYLDSEYRRLLAGESIGRS